MNKYGLPYNVLRDPNSWDKSPRDPISVGNFILATLSIQTSSIALIYITGFTVTTLVTAAIARALMPSPPAMKEGLLGNFRQSAAPWDIVYGQVRKGGTITYMESTGNKNKYLHMIISLAGHEVEEIGDVYVNDKVVDIDANNWVTSDPWGTNKIYVEKFTGSSSQDIYTTLSALPNDDGQRPTFSDEATSNTPSNFKGQGIACLYVRLEYNRDTFAGGIPSFSAVIKGKKVFDPRSNTTAYSANAALCIRDYLVSEYGLDTPVETIDDTYLSTAANDCDASSGSGAPNKFEINGVIKTDRNIRTNLQDMVGACAGKLYYSAGKFKLLAGTYNSPVKSLTIDDLRSEISLNTRISRRDNFNSVQGTFVWSGVDDGTGSGGDWIETEYPPITSSVFVAEDNGYDNPLQLDLPLTTNSATAQRIAKQILFRSREQAAFTADFGMEAFDLEVGDTVNITFDRYGWTNKTFEVTSWGFKADQDAGDLRVTLGLKETSAAAYSWNAEERDIIGNGPVLPDPNAGLTINNLTAVGGGRTQGDGTFINSVLLNWDDILNAYIDYYDVEWKPLSDSVYNTATSNVSDIEISPLIDGVQYVFRVRAVTMSGKRGEWATITFTGGGDTTAPGLPTGVTATGHFKYIDVSWTNPADTDLNYIEVYENTVNDSASAGLVGISAGDNFIRANLGLEQTRYYFLKAVDYSGNKSDFTTGVSATTTYLDDPDFENGIYTLFKDQGLYAIRDVTGLPTSGAFTGEKVFNRTDGKLYTWTGTAWEATVSDVGPGSITATEIADDAITTPKLAANAVTASKILAGTITGDKIAANTITTGLLQASGVIANSAMIVDGIITNAKISDLSANKINAGTISVDYLPGLTSIAQTITGSNINLVSGSSSQYLLTQTLSGIRAGTKVVGILTLNAYSTTSAGPGSNVGCTMEIVPQNISGLTSHTFQKNNHPALGVSSSFMVMQTFIGTGTATGTSCSVQFRLGTAFTGETGVMLAGASLTLLGYEV